MSHKESPKKIKDKFYFIRYPGGYGDMEIYPSTRSVRSYNKQMLKKDPEFEEFKNSKKGFFEYY